MRGNHITTLMACISVLLVGSVMAGTSASDKSAKAIKQKQIHMQAQSLDITGTLSIGVTNGFGSVKVWDFDAGRILVHGAVLDATVAIDTNYVADASGINMACGTVAAASTTGAVSFTSTQADIIPNVEVDPWTNGVTRFSTALAASAQFDGTTTAKDIYVNLLVDADDITTNVTAYITGDLTITYSELGDY